MSNVRALLLKPLSARPFRLRLVLALQAQCSIEPHAGFCTALRAILLPPSTSPILAPSLWHDFGHFFSSPASLLLPPLRHSAHIFVPFLASFVLLGVGLVAVSRSFRSALSIRLCAFKLSQSFLVRPRLLLRSALSPPSFKSFFRFSSRSATSIQNGRPASHIKSVFLGLPCAAFKRQP
jgi:hypothetical protein